jgi:hypothetical protein
MILICVMLVASGQFDYPAAILAVAVEVGTLGDQQSTGSDVVFQGVDGNDYTYRQSFNDDRQGWTVEAGETVARILNEVGIIDLPYWELGTPWDQYKIPQTYEEEKRDALESEHGY